MISATRGILQVTVLLVVMSSGTVAQTIHGTVTERVSGGPARGTLITLERTNGDSGLIARSVLTNANGAYSVSAPSAGTFQIVARRIGSLPYRSEAFTLTSGQRRLVDIVMEPATRYGASATLGTVSITRATPCPDRASNGERIATLWQDARIALLSSEIAIRDRLVSYRQVRYKRELELPLMDIISETFTVFDAEDTDGERWFKPAGGRAIEIRILA